MRLPMIAAIGTAALLALSACNNAKSPDSEAKDLAAANQSAASEVADAQHDAQKDASKDAYSVALAQADGDHKIALQKCDALQGHDQDVCKQQADADYDAAKANAQAAKAATTP
jgi:hypothetical protein